MKDFDPLPRDLARHLSQTSPPTPSGCREDSLSLLTGPEKDKALEGPLPRPWCLHPQPGPDRKRTAPWLPGLESLAFCLWRPCPWGSHTPPAVPFLSAESCVALGTLFSPPPHPPVTCRASGRGTLCSLPQLAFLAASLGVTAAATEKHVRMSPRPGVWGPGLWRALLLLAGWGRGRCERCPSCLPSGYFRSQAIVGRQGPRGICRQGVGGSDCGLSASRDFEEQEDGSSSSGVRP